MKCPKCQHDESKVEDSRTIGDTIKRVRRCGKCKERYVTFEFTEIQIAAIKRDAASKYLSLHSELVRAYMILKESIRREL